MIDVEQIILSVVCIIAFFGYSIILFNGTLRKYFLKDTLRENGTTRDVNLTIENRIDNDKEFAEALLTEAISCFATKDVYTAKGLLKKLIETDIGLAVLFSQFNKNKIK